MAAVALLILQRPYPQLVTLAELAVWIAIIFTVASGIDYLWRFRHVLWPLASTSSPQGGDLAQRAGGGAEAVDPLARELGGLLVKGGLTLSVAESCTAGLLGALITDQPGSSAYFMGGVIAYADEVKREQLGVPTALLTRHGAVSKEVALAMAEGARSRFGTTLAASITGVAGPDAEGSKPVGLTYVAVATPRGASCHEYLFRGDRWSNRRQAAGEALRLLIEAALVNQGKLAS
jgi:nicotinamide-nucleotide amidase